MLYLPWIHLLLQSSEDFSGHIQLFTALLTKQTSGSCYITNLSNSWFSLKIPCLFLEGILITSKQVQISPLAPSRFYLVLFLWLLNGSCEQINPVNAIKGFIVTQIYTNSLIITPFHLTDFFSLRTICPTICQQGKWPCIKRQEEMNANNAP